jgi:hypothetical protein
MLKCAACDYPVMCGHSVIKQAIKHLQRTITDASEAQIEELAGLN